MIPTYVHCPLITDENHKKLSKRCGHSSYEDLIDQGFVSEAVVNFVALLGWSPSDNREIFSLEELVEAFDYHHISKSPAVFDPVKLRWMNGEYIKAMDFEAFFEKAEPYILEVITKDYDLQKNRNISKDTYRNIFGYQRPDRFSGRSARYDSVEMYAHKKMKTNPKKILWSF